jgi:hypothetical protein
MVHEVLRQRQSCSRLGECFNIRPCSPAALHRASFLGEVDEVYQAPPSLRVNSAKSFERRKKGRDSLACLPARRPRMTDKKAQTRCAQDNGSGDGRNVRFTGDGRHGVLEGQAREECSAAIPSRAGRGRPQSSCMLVATIVGLSETSEKFQPVRARRSPAT